MRRGYEWLLLGTWADACSERIALPGANLRGNEGPNQLDFAGPHRTAARSSPVHGASPARESPWYFQFDG